MFPAFWAGPVAMSLPGITEILEESIHGAGECLPALLPSLLPVQYSRTMVLNMWVLTPLEVTHQLSCVSHIYLYYVL